VRTPETILSMVDKETPIVSAVVKSNVGTCVKDSNSVGAKGIVKTTDDTSSSEVEKGNPGIIFKSFASESDKDLGIEDLDTVRNSPEHLNMDDPKTKADSIQCTLEKTEELKDVELNVEPSLSQQDEHVNDDEIAKEDKSREEIDSDKGSFSEHSTEKSSPEEEGRTNVEDDSEENVYENGSDEDLVMDENIVSEDVPLAETKIESVAKRLRSNKGKAVLTKEETPNTKKKVDGVGPKKGWSKVKVNSTAGKMRKRKVVSSSESEYDVEKDVQSISHTVSRKSTSRKTMQTVVNVPIDKVSFHLPKNALRWKFVYHMRLALERELSKEALEIDAVIELIKGAGLMKTVCNLGDCYEKLVKEFLVNIPDDCDDPLSSEYQKVFVRGECVNFSPSIINKFLGVEDINIPKLKIKESQVCKEIIGNQIMVWSKKKKILSGKLSVKDAVLNRIAAVNWVPTNNSSDIATGLGKFIYFVSTKTKMNIGQYIFDQTVKHAKTDVVKCPIAFPTLLCGIMLEQHPRLITAADIPEKREPPLTLHPKLFRANHVPDIVGTSRGVPAAGLMTKQEIVIALKDTCVMLEERKTNFELMIQSLVREDATTHQTDAEEDNADEADNDDENNKGDSDSSSGTAE
jgi:hypothetical protein